jgi:hypothetical protein
MTYETILCKNPEGNKNPKAYTTWAVRNLFDVSLSKRSARAEALDVPGPTAALVIGTSYHSPNSRLIIIVAVFNSEEEAAWNGSFTEV